MQLQSAVSALPLLAKDGRQKEVAMDDKQAPPSVVADNEAGSQIVVDKSTERSYGEPYTPQIISSVSNMAPVRKMDLWLLPFMSMMYFFNSVDRVSRPMHSIIHPGGSFGEKGQENRYANP
jgi:hypothetical protein